MLYLIGYNIEGKNVLHLTDDNSLRGSENIEQAKNMLPDLNPIHKRGYTWSMSAAIYWMFFKPRLFSFENMAQVEQALHNRHIMQYSHTSGHVNGLQLKDDYKVNVVEECKLITEKFNNL